MAVLLYPNGLTEHYQPKVHTFTDEEFLGIFPDYNKIRTFRLYEVPNTWCVWGEYTPVDKIPEDFNKVGTDILDQGCYSPVLFVHDTEVDPSWNLTDTMIISGYEDFKVEMLKFFDEIAADIQIERQKIREQAGDSYSQMKLKQIGVSEDKRIIFEFDLDEQIPEFFMEDNLLDFAKKVHNFLKFSYKDGDIFAIYADKNIIITMQEKPVKSFIDKLIAFFMSREQYEACSVLRNTFDRWKKWKKAKAKQINQPPPAPEEDNKPSNEEEPGT